MPLLNHIPATEFTISAFVYTKYVWWNDGRGNFELIRWSRFLDAIMADGYYNALRPDIEIIGRVSDESTLFMYIRYRGEDEWRDMPDECLRVIFHNSNQWIYVPDRME